MLYRFAHKTGSYGVSVIEGDDNQVLVQIEQVIKHPKQGDLHHPNETKNVFFHERKALSQFEKRYTSKSKLRPFNVEELDYIQSLQIAITNLENKLKEENTEYANCSLANLAQLKKDYSIQYKQNFE